MPKLNPNGRFYEIGGQGKSLRIHKKGTVFEYYPKRTQKLLDHKLIRLRKYILRAFPYTEELIIDCKVLMFDISGGEVPIFANSKLSADMKFMHIFLLVTDCTYCDGDISLRTFEERREIVKRIMIEIPNCVVLSKIDNIRRLKILDDMKAKMTNLVFRGLVRKNYNGICGPGRSFYLKVLRAYFLFSDKFTIDVFLIKFVLSGEAKEGNVVIDFVTVRYDSNEKIIRKILEFCVGQENIVYSTVYNITYFIKTNAHYSEIPIWFACIKDILSNIIVENPHTDPFFNEEETTPAEHITDSANEMPFQFPGSFSMENVNCDSFAVSNNDENNFDNILTNKRIINVKEKETKKRELENANEESPKKMQIPNNLEEPEKVESEKLEEDESEELIAPIKRRTPNNVDNLNNFLGNKCIAKPTKRKLDYASEKNMKKCRITFDSVTEKPESEKTMPIKQHIEQKSEKNKEELNNASVEMPEPENLDDECVEEPDSENDVSYIRIRTLKIPVRMNDIRINKFIKNKKNEIAIGSLTGSSEYEMEKSEEDESEEPEEDESEESEEDESEESEKDEPEESEENEYEKSVEAKTDESEEGETNKRKLKNANVKKPNKKKLSVPMLLYVRKSLKKFDTLIMHKCLKNAYLNETDAFVINSATEESQESTVPVKRRVSKYFKNICLVVYEEAITKYRFYIKNFVACGGTIVRCCYYKEYAAHMLYKEPQEPVTISICDLRIIVRWIFDTIRFGALQDNRKYRIVPISGEVKDGKVSN